MRSSHRIKSDCPKKNDRHIVFDSGADQSRMHDMFPEHDADIQAEQVECLEQGMHDKNHSYFIYVSVSMVLTTLLEGTLLLLRHWRARSLEVILSRDQLEDQAESERIAQMAGQFNSQPRKADKYVGEENKERNKNLLSGL